ncbi:hypothetical protein PAAG_06119 [Paracoccidioides lutzii Pb01]|uniref:Aminoglycoside phosphotransferase domain-containing protein n=1 Tax=Paracoccidioides lutzii (strain ATCC MYA-826 / Pb01) TaxID=502779 RepID=C1H609_PARBA|nr:hypothetical protein PAAG_06119 [Paracoccidioides lutzii Pb01]EEH35072.2 hypothetical protein PAAG_06119 [Paracoccidioides lutzii Pb01]
MPLRRCDVHGCSQSAARRNGGCPICSRNHCGAHIKSDSHQCLSKARLVYSLSWDAHPDGYREECVASQRVHISKTLDQLDIDALTSLASSLRGGVPCSIPALAADKETVLRLLVQHIVDMDFHFDINFRDGVVWDARIRLPNDALPPLPVQKHIFLSEMFTLKFLEKTAVPAPRVYHYGWIDATDNPVGVSFVLLEKMGGRKLQWDKANKTTQTKILEQLADISLELERHDFEMTGSIVPSDDGVVQIGGYAMLPLFRDSRTPIGPFSSLSASLRAIIYLQLDMIMDGEFSNLPIGHFLSYLWRLNMIPDLVASINSKEGGPFYLKRFCERDDHILVDDDGNITAIMGWASSSVKPKEYAFSSPSMLWPTTAFVNGDNTLSPAELEFAEIYRRRGRDDMAEIVLDGRKLQRFLYSLGDSWTDDEDEFEALFLGLRKAFIREGDEVAAKALQEPFEYWKKKSIPMYSVQYPQLQLLF